MAHRNQRFKDALSSIEPSHDKGRAALKADTMLAGYGNDPDLIRSQKRNVSIRRVKDVPGASSTLGRNS